jgi:hypothetical protein
VAEVSGEGGVESSTVTVCTTDAVLPLRSAALKVRRKEPLHEVPDWALVEVTTISGESSHTSNAEGMTVGTADEHSMAVSAGTLTNSGGSRSCTVIVWVTVLELAWPSSTDQALYRK